MKRHREKYAVVYRVSRDEPKRIFMTDLTYERAFALLELLFRAWPPGSGLDILPMGPRTLRNRPKGS